MYIDELKNRKNKLWTGDSKYVNDFSFHRVT